MREHELRERARAERARANRELSAAHDVLDSQPVFEQPDHELTGLVVREQHELRQQGTS